MPRAESYNSIDNRAAAFSGYGSNKKKSSETFDGIEIFEPKNKPRPSSATHFSVSPITIDNMEIDTAGLIARVIGRPPANGLWGLGENNQHDTPQTGHQGNPNDSLPGLSDNVTASTTGIAAAGYNRQKIMSCTLEGSKNGDSVAGDGADGSGNDASKGPTHGGGTAFSLRGSTTFSPVTFRKQLKPKVDKAVAEATDDIDLPTTRPPPMYSPPKIMFGANSPLSGKKTIQPTAKPVVQKAVPAEPHVKSILKKNSFGPSCKKAVKFDLAGNMYDEHVPYASPEKQVGGGGSNAAESVVENRSKKLSASMRAPVIGTLQSSYGSTLWSGDADPNCAAPSSSAPTCSGDGGSIRHSRDSLKYQSNYHYNKSNDKA